MDFQKYVKHLRYYGNHIYQYHHKEVEKRFKEALKILGEPKGNDYAVFITLRLKGKSDWITANNASNRLEWKLCKYLWKTKGKYMLKNGTAPYVSSIEHNLFRIKDHIHAVIRLSNSDLNLPQYYSLDEIQDKIKEIALDMEEVDKKNPDNVCIRIFPYTDKTEEQEKEVGNTLEYICKTSSKHHNPLKRQILNKEQREKLSARL
jgi:hypothetical protein